VLVDNDEAVITLLKLDLGLEGYDIAATADDGESAIRACEEHDPDVVVLDFKLGKGLDGIDVAREVARPGRRLVLHTNYVSSDILKRAADAGVIVVEKGSLRALRRAIADTTPLH
jgi:CheY-like chemotaxis protein